MAQDTINLTLEPRTITGKAVKRLRKSGKIPAVIHDHGRPSIIVEVDSLNMQRVYQQAGKHHPLNLDAGGKSYTALIKNVEYDPHMHHISHVVFNAVAADQVVEAEVPVEPKYQADNAASPAERSGLIVLTNLESVEVEALPKDLPDVIFYDAEKLVEIGDQVSVADLIVPANVTIKTEPTHAIATVYEPSALAAKNESAGGEVQEEVPSEEESAEETQPEGDKTELEQGTTSKQ